MNAWFIAHEDNPYPNRNDLDYLATNGGIKESQVKAWFSNKRNRTQNTHPKRAKRYLVRHQAASWNEPQKIHIADTLEQRAMMVQQSVYSNIQLPEIPSNDWLWSSGNAYHYCHQWWKKEHRRVDVLLTVFFLWKNADRWTDLFIYVQILKE